MDETQIEKLRRLFDLDTYESGIPALLAMAHPEIEVVPASTWLDMESQVHRGHDGVRDYYRSLNEAFGRIQYRLVDLEVRGDVAIAEVLIEAEGKGSGVATTLPAFQVFWLEDGLIRRVEGHFDRERAVAAAEA